MDLDLELTPDHAGRPAPASFRFGGHRRDVLEQLDYWPGADHEYFKVKTEGATFILRHDIEAERWELTLYVADDLPEGVPGWPPGGGWA